MNTFNGETRLYVDGIYEKETIGATSTHVHFIFAGGEAVAIHKSRTDGVLQTRYPHRDHLRSVSGITNETGAVVESSSYDVWGKRRNTNWTESGTQLFSTQTPRGYTGHEQLDHASLVHMNGRVYDPNLGRMLSPDPIVQAPGYSQSFNRYSYVFNNPLPARDPSGFETESWFWPFVFPLLTRHETFSSDAEFWAHQIQLAMWKTWMDHQSEIARTAEGTWPDPSEQGGMPSSAVAGSASPFGLYDFGPGYSAYPAHPAIHSAEANGQASLGRYVG